MYITIICAQSMLFQHVRVLWNVLCKWRSLLLYYLISLTFRVYFIIIRILFIFSICDIKYLFPQFIIIYFKINSVFINKRSLSMSFLDDSFVKPSHHTQARNLSRRYKFRIHRHGNLIVKTSASSFFTFFGVLT